MNTIKKREKSVKQTVYDSSKVVLLHINETETSGGGRGRTNQRDITVEEEYEFGGVQMTSYIEDSKDSKS